MTELQRPESVRSARPHKAKVGERWPRAGRRRAPRGAVGEPPAAVPSRRCTRPAGRERRSKSASRGTHCHALEPSGAGALESPLHESVGHSGGEPFAEDRQVRLRKCAASCPGLRADLRRGARSRTLEPGPPSGSVHCGDCRRERSTALHAQSRRLCRARRHRGSRGDRKAELARPCRAVERFRQVGNRRRSRDHAAGGGRADQRFGARPGIRAPAEG